MCTPTRLFQIGFALSARAALGSMHVLAGISNIEQAFKDGGIGDSGMCDELNTSGPAGQMTFVCVITIDGFPMRGWIA